MGDLASSRKTSQSSTTSNRQVGQQGQTNSAFTGDINISQQRSSQGNTKTDSAAGERAPGNMAGDVIAHDVPVTDRSENGGSSTVNLDFSSTSDEIAKAAIEAAGTQSNLALLGALQGTQSIVGRSIDFANDTQQRFADALEPALPSDDGRGMVKILTGLGIGAGLFFLLKHK